MRPPQNAGEDAADSAALLPEGMCFNETPAERGGRQAEDKDNTSAFLWLQ